MAIEIIYFPPGAKGVGEGVLRTAINGLGAGSPRDFEGPDYSRALYLVPGRKTAEARLRTFHSLVSGPYIPPEFLTIKGLSSRLYSYFGGKALIPETLVALVLSALSGKSIGLSTITARFISEMRHHYPGISHEKLRGFFIGAFNELTTPEAVSKRVFEALDTMSRYDALMHEKGFIDEVSALIESPRLIEEKLPPLDVLVIDGFYEPGEAEKRVLKALIQKAERTIISIPFDERFSNLTDDYISFLKNNFKFSETLFPARPRAGLTYHPYASPEDEAEGIARHIKSSFIAGRLRDLDSAVVAFPLLGQYEDTIGRVFRRYGIPFTMSGPPLSHTRPFLDMFSMLDAVAGDYPRLSFSSLGLSPYFEGIPPEFKAAMPAMSLGSGIIKGKGQWLKEFGAHGVLAEGRRLLRRLRPLESIKSKGAYSDYLEALAGVFTSLGFNGPENGPETIDILRQAGLLDEITAGHTDLAGFTEGLRHILGRTYAEAEPGGVSVMGIEDAFGLEPGFLYIGGLKDGDIPSMPEADHLMTEGIRAKLGLTSLKRHLMRQEFIFEHLASSTSGLYLSYPTMQGDKSFLPSFFLRESAGQKERVSGVFCPEEALIKKGSASGVGLSRHMGQFLRVKGLRRFSSGSYIHVTAIDAYRLCPRRFFIERVLELKPREIKDFKLDALTVGEMLHKVMERLIPGSGTADYESFREKASRVADETIEKWPIDGYWLALLKESFLDMLPDIYKVEESLRAEGFSFRSAELRVKGEPLKGIKLRGKIDRLDGGATGPRAIGGTATCEGLRAPTTGSAPFLVLDYKTGAATLSSKDVLEKGASLQLLLYAALLRPKYNVGRVGLYSLKEARIKWLPKIAGARSPLGLDDYISAALMYLDNTVGRMRQGDFTAMPLKEGQTCRLCHERPYCPYIQGED